MPFPAGVSLVGSTIVHIVVKLVTDFTAIIDFRHPYELGGLYFSLNLFLPLIGLAFLLGLDFTKEILSESTLALLTSVTILLGTGLITLFGTFLLLMNKEYRHTFIAATGTGPVDVVYKAIDKLIGISVELETYGMQAVNEGIGAVATTRVYTLSRGRRSVYISALNKMIAWTKRRSEKRRASNGEGEGSAESVPLGDGASSVQIK
ncbi:hypothetical protein TrVE_jg3400 [Triparma verrucosa]|uniref:2-isopropylmalate synthase LeuA allosteric (dimerisation) domain-containing protein n=1 Tax=Triparma verrucosa TaxID=1606542 RepID=A0A9W7F4B3_9STRA|nr:hypothetical protein TrVE_jg3400 [Triparma verrucosa]